MKIRWKLDENKQNKKIRREKIERFFSGKVKEIFISKVERNFRCENWK